MNGKTVVISGLQWKIEQRLNTLSGQMMTRFVHVLDSGNTLSTRWRYASNGAINYVVSNSTLLEFGAKALSAQAQETMQDFVAQKQEAIDGYHIGDIIQTAYVNSRPARKPGSGGHDRACVVADCLEYNWHVGFAVFEIADKLFGFIATHSMQDWTRSNGDLLNL